ncbi:CCC motif membrane protein [Flagellimonas eckloniae]|uniref:Membrane protein n=1 Tax=Flagellimonas eckloniae TaxID=346185 RepID=A0A0Q0XBS5_9FLAO|nr:CCC motif membrane protein [Allomuricauda eckloniae]KQC28541.1 membrane protein [Allomuricauda eckloniae]
MEQQKLPNSTLILVFGIISIVTCCCYGILGLIFGIIALVLANKATKIYMENPEMYEDFKNVKTGKILAIIGIILNVLFLIYIIWAISFFGWESLQDPEKLQEILEQYQ